MEKNISDKNLFTLSVVSTVFSEEDTIISLVDYFHKNFIDNISEIILVYHPKSNDKCLKILNKLDKDYNKVKILEEKFTKKGGNGKAYRQGFKHVTGSHVLMIDSDGEMDVNTFPEMIKKMTDTNCDIVVGSRYLRSGGFVGYPFGKFILNKTFQYIFRFLYSTKIKDLTCGYKLLKRSVVDKYKWTCDYQDIGAETTLRPLKGGDHIEEVHTVWTMKQGEKHSLSFFGNLKYPILALKILFNI